MDPIMSATRLASLLDKIDQTKSTASKTKVAESNASSEEPKAVAAQQPTEASEGTSSSTDAASNKVSECHNSTTFSGWYEYLDGKSCKRYYHNYNTGVTQWEKPDADDIIKAPPPAPLSRPSDEVYVEKAYFNKTGGRFSHSGEQSYWAKMGREEDKAGRQLGVFMDLSTLEANREEAKRMKEEAQQRSGSRGNVDWSAYKEQKQMAKKRKAQSWLFED